VREVQSRLRLLEIGPRVEEIAEQRRRIERAKVWPDRAREDLRRTEEVLQEELTRLDQQIAQYQAKLEASRVAVNRSKMLLPRAAIAVEQYQLDYCRFRAAQAQLEQARAERRARQAKGVREAEEELACRDKELADAQAVLAVLEVGNRPEEIAAERARLERLQEEALYLERLQDKLTLSSPVGGVITTPRLKEKAGEYVREGEVICRVEETGRWRRRSLWPSRTWRGSGLVSPWS
jgi:hypothetical protein